MDTIQNPHDKFFKEIFTHKETAEDFLRQYLPTDVVSLLDLTSLEYSKDSFIDQDLEELFSDLLLKVSFTNGFMGYVYILLEHKSYQEPFTAFHLLRYLVKIWEAALKKKEILNFPVVIPIVLYHGENRWRAGASLSDLLECPEMLPPSLADVLSPYIPDFRYLLWDASGVSDDEIRGTVILRVALLLFKHIFNKDLRDRLPGILTLLRDLIGKRTGMEYMDTVLRYLLNAPPAGRITYDDVKNAVEEAFPQIGGEIMATIADTLIERGIQQGKQQGLQQGLQQGIIQNACEDVLEILNIRFGMVSQSLLNTIQRIDNAALLKTLLRQAITVQSLEDFTQAVKKIMT
ncbi:MAG: Rpn family recombination-promoting nuclease/putative transposase [bacterium]|nr:Rpn family recombination-promoting nuclease/putative transposase [bacterium]